MDYHFKTAVNMYNKCIYIYTPCNVSVYTISKAQICICVYRKSI